MIYIKHKWNGPDSKVKATTNNGGLMVACLRCGCIKEYVAGKVTYFANDNVYYTSPSCDEIKKQQTDAQ